MTPWKFTDATRSVVMRVNEDGSMESHLTSQPDIAAWLATGNVPLAPDLPPSPGAITKRQVLLWLLTIGKLESDVTAAIAAIADSTQRARAQIEWDYPDQGMIRRNHPLVAQIGAVFGLTPAQIDDGYAAAVLL